MFGVGVVVLVEGVEGGVESLGVGCVVVGEDFDGFGVWWGVGF